MTSIVRWINENDAAQHVQRSQRTLRTWRRAGEVIAHNHGKNRVMYLVESLEACKQLQAERYRQNVGRPPNS